MKLKIDINILRPVVLGIFLGAVVVIGLERFRHTQVQQPAAVQKNNTWPPPEFQSTSSWIYSKIDESGWSTGPVGSYKNLNERFDQLTTSDRQIVLPIFPTVYTPQMVDKIYYDAILESDISNGDKVLVIGTGSGADAWVASTKSEALVYVVEINPMAIANARAAARLGNFQIKPVVGDITKIDLPDDFREFDFVLWNMPFVWTPSRIEANKINIEGNSFHDGDDGRILKRFLELLPSLLKKGGKAIVLNNYLAAEFITTPGVKTNSTSECTLYVIPIL